MPAAEPRKCVGRVSDESLQGWTTFCDRHGIDRACFAEVVGYWLAEGGDLPPVVEQWVRDARDLKNQRRRRG